MMLQEWCGFHWWCCIRGSMEYWGFPRFSQPLMAQKTKFPWDYKSCQWGYISASQPAFSLFKGYTYNKLQYLLAEHGKFQASVQVSNLAHHALLGWILDQSSYCNVVSWVFSKQFPAMFQKSSSSRKASIHINSDKSSIHLNCNSCVWITWAALR